MKDDKRARLILERWTSELASKDRSKNKLAENFEELYYDMFKANIPFEVAHDTIKQATAHHFPNQSTSKWTFKNAKRDPNQTFAEFLDGWKKLIADEATKAFYAYYSVEGEEAKKEEKKHGNMSAAEYSKQRKHAESFPIIDTDELERQRKEIMKEDGGSDER